MRMPINDWVITGSRGAGQCREERHGVHANSSQQTSKITQDLKQLTADGAPAPTARRAQVGTGRVLLFRIARCFCVTNPHRAQLLPTGLNHQWTSPAVTSPRAPPPPLDPRRPPACPTESRGVPAARTPRRQIPVTLPSRLKLAAARRSRSGKPPRSPLTVGARVLLALAARRAPARSRLALAVEGGEIGEQSFFFLIQYLY
ncbi:unnamed protein product [Urochloa humidicola]